MSIKVHIPAPLRQHTGGLAVVELSGGSVKAVLEGLAGQYPALTERVMENGSPRRFVNVFVNDEDIRYLDSLDTAVKDGDAISIIPAVAGG